MIFVPPAQGAIRLADGKTRERLRRVVKGTAVEWTLRSRVGISARAAIKRGAVSVYGMGRFPVTLYKEQWLKLLDMSDDIRAFITANEARLKSRD